MFFSEQFPECCQNEVRLSNRTHYFFEARFEKRPSVCILLLFIIFLGYVMSAVTSVLAYVEI